LQGSSVAFHYWEVVFSLFTNWVESEAFHYWEVVLSLFAWRVAMKPSTSGQSFIHFLLGWSH
jgi:hypothetical protein